MYHRIKANIYILYNYFYGCFIVYLTLVKLVNTTELAGLAAVPKTKQNNVQISHQK